MTAIEIPNVNHTARKIASAYQPAYTVVGAISRSRLPASEEIKRMNNERDRDLECQ